MVTICTKKFCKPSPLELNVPPERSTLRELFKQKYANRLAQKEQELKENAGDSTPKPQNTDDNITSDNLTAKTPSNDGSKNRTSGDRDSLKNRNKKWLNLARIKSLDKTSPTISQKTSISDNSANKLSVLKGTSIPNSSLRQKLKEKLEKIEESDPLTEIIKTESKRSIGGYDSKMSFTSDAISGSSGRISELKEMYQNLHKSSYVPKETIVSKRIPTLEAIKSAIEKEKNSLQEKNEGTEENQPSCSSVSTSTAEDGIIRKKKLKKKIKKKKKASVVLKESKAIVKVISEKIQSTIEEKGKNAVKLKKVTKQGVIAPPPMSSVKRIEKL